MGRNNSKRRRIAGKSDIIVNIDGERSFQFIFLDFLRVKRLAVQKREKKSGVARKIL